MTNESLLSHWRERFADFTRSGLGVSAWCAAHEVPLHRYYYWRRKLSVPTTPDSDINWLTLAVSEAARPTSLAVRVRTAVIDVAPGFDPALLRAIVGALEADQC